MQTIMDSDHTNYAKRVYLNRKKAIFDTIYPISAVAMIDIHQGSTKL